MTIAEWFDSGPMRHARLAMSGSALNSFCVKCYNDESHSGTSRRHKCNQKSVIFTKSNFAKSFEQSPHHKHFTDSFATQGSYQGMPIDLHIDLGNFCNLTCKMCNPGASSSIAVQHVKWGIENARQFLGTDWTRDDLVWQRFLNELRNLAGLKNIHFMGGETLLTKKFEEFVDYMIAHKKFDLHFSFVTNGTTFNEPLMDKLSLFKRVGIEVSIESLTRHNAYQRQGTNTREVIDNIDRYLRYCDGKNITVTARPAISALTIGYYHTLLQYCLDRGIIVKSMTVYRPPFLDCKVLPLSVKKQYIKHYIDFLNDNNLVQEDISKDFNESDPNELKRIIKQQALQCISLLEQDSPTNNDDLLGQMVRWCERWDKVASDLDARVLYPEFREILEKHAYQI